MISDNTIIPLFTGELKFAKNIDIGDILTGDDGGPRWVLNIKTSLVENESYKITQEHGESYIVTGDHILVLTYLDHKKFYLKNVFWQLNWWDSKVNKPQSILMKDREDLLNFSKTIDDNNTIHISVKDFLAQPDHIKKHLVGIRTKCVDWAYEYIDISPYLLGLWLGDSICNNNIDTYLPVKNYLDGYHLGRAKYIPRNYILNGREIRMHVLAGFIDSYTNIVIKDDVLIITLDNCYFGLIYDILIIARSLGFRCHITINENTTYNLHISGLLSEIPVKQTSHILKDTDVNFNGNIIVEKYESKAGQNAFIQIAVDDNGRYLISDFSVTL
jgi:hypothetical protein